MYADISEQYRELLKGLRPIGDPAAASIERSVPGVPHDYLAFLQEVGWGGLGESRFMIYEGPVEAQEVYPGLEQVWLFGDDFAGYAAGFDERNVGSSGGRSPWQSQ